MANDHFWIHFQIKKNYLKNYLSLVIWLSIKSIKVVLRFQYIDLKEWIPVYALTAVYCRFWSHYPMLQKDATYPIMHISQSLPEAAQKIPNPQCPILHISQSLPWSKCKMPTPLLPYTAHLSLTALYWTKDATPSLPYTALLSVTALYCTKDANPLTALYCTFISHCSILHEGCQPLHCPILHI